MQQTSRTVLTALLGAVLFMAACNDGGPTGVNEGDELTPVETNEIFAEIFNELAGLFLLGGVGGGPQLAVGPTLIGIAPVTVSQTINESGSCEGGGTVTVTGSISGDIDEQAQTGTVTLDVTETINNCVVVTSTGTTFTVNTSPPIRMTGDFTITQTSFSLAFDITGGFTFTGSDGRSGSCLIDVSMSATVTGTTVAQESVSGTVCGQSITDL